MLESLQDSRQRRFITQDGHEHPLRGMRMEVLVLPTDPVRLRCPLGPVHEENFSLFQSVLKFGLPPHARLDGAPIQKDPVAKSFEQEG